MYVERPQNLLYKLLRVKKGTISYCMRRTGLNWDYPEKMHTSGHPNYILQGKKCKNKTGRQITEVPPAESRQKYHT